MVKRNEIVEFCNEYLKADTFNDYCHNGLQIEGRENISKIVIGVSLSRQFIEKAIDEEADMIIVHHGLFKNQLGDPPRIVGIFKERIKLLMEHDINLCGYHLPLDAHPEIGNNISLARLLELRNLEHLNSPYYGEIGYIGDLKENMKFIDFLAYVNTMLNTQSYILAAGHELVKKVGIISGGSSIEYSEAYKQGADTFITGDIKENIVREVEEIGMNFINAGHYNTEKLGIQNLGKLVSERFNVEMKFIDIPCEV
ncbi:MAG: Nif3-like dinuclear metal center hexameric protein [Candidatus Celaenobacter antarcticus]|nr:Nif3-like dinuclear metal center hexameric protein [Candidatus Celaenobacter antarcticus]MDP8315384.1 Nif3-like dinuclear metal center hexameric protein [Candidatus Celaenobacter antarcticus]